MSELFPARLTVQVLPAHIQRGKICNGMRCPIALATNDALNLIKIRPANIRAEVWPHRVYVCERGTPFARGQVIATYELPRVARQFIEAFDILEPVDPLTFTMVKRGT